MMADDSVKFVPDFGVHRMRRDRGDPAFKR